MESLRRKASLTMLLLAGFLFTLPAKAADLQTLSDWYQTLRETLEIQYNITEVFIAGGSSRSLLDYAKKGEGLRSMSDFDIFIVANQKVTKKYAGEIAKSLSRAGLGYVPPQSLEVRLRGNPQLPESLERYNYDPGSGFLIKNSKLLGDINIFHSFEDLKTNGIFSIDMIYLRVPKDKTLKEFVQNDLTTLSRQDLKKGEILYDPHNGCTDWDNGKISLINSAELLRDPVLKATRVIRSFAKLHKLDALAKNEAWATLKVAIGNSTLQDRVRFHRNLLKVLKLDESAFALKLLSESGALGLYDSDLDNLVIKTSLENLQSLLNQAHDPEEKLESLKTVHEPEVSFSLDYFPALSSRELERCERRMRLQHR